MKTRLLYFISVFFILIFALSGCGKDDNGFTGLGPEFEWVPGGTKMTYVNMGGVVSAFNFIGKIDVIKGSGNIEINIEIDGDSESQKTGTFQVERGKQYKLSVRAGIDGRTLSNPSDHCMTVSYSSPNCRNDSKINLDSYLVPSSNDLIGDTYYCPENLVISEIIISEIN